MAISGITTNYSGRLTDINLLYDIDPKIPGGQKVRPRFSPQSSFVAGIQKLVQRYATALLTDIASQETFPDFGTRLIPSVTQVTRTVSVNDLEHYFNVANLKVNEEFRRFQAGNRDYPRDELLYNATLLDCFIADDAVYFHVLIRSAAGEEVEFVLPLPDHVGSI